MYPVPSLDFLIRSIIGVSKHSNKWCPVSCQYSESELRQGQEGVGQCHPNSRQELQTGDGHFVWERHGIPLQDTGQQA